MALMDLSNRRRRPQGSRRAAARADRGQCASPVLVPAHGLGLAHISAKVAAPLGKSPGGHMVFIRRLMVPLQYRTTVTLLPT